MKIRCADCNKKLRLGMQITCRCGKVFCIQHSLSVEHKCSYDYKKEHQEWLTKTMPVVECEKIIRL